MKKIALSLIALAAVSTAALAERNYDLRDADTYMGKFSAQSVSDESAAAIAASNWTIFYGRYGSTTDADEARRWDEKNG
jgi:hypothetical protein